MPALHSPCLGSVPRFAILSLLVACGAPAPGPAPVAPVAAKPDDVTIALNWFPEAEFGGLYEAELDGLYQKANLNVTIQPGGAGAPVVPEVASGRVQFGVSMADEVVLARGQGVDIVTVFATYQTHPLGIMVHASRGLKDLSELTTGTLAVEDGIPFAQYLFKKYGWKGLTRVPYGGGVGQWLLDPNYAQQVYVTSEPILAKKQGGDTQVFLVADTGYNPYANVLITASSLAKSNPDLVGRFVRATAAGWDAYLKNGAKANARIHELNPTMDADVLQASAESQKPLISGGQAAKAGVGVMEEARWAELVAQLKDVGALTADVDPKACFTNEFLPHSP